MNSVANQTWRWWLEWLHCLYLQVTVLKKHKQHKWATSQNSQLRARTQDLFYRSSVPLIVLHKHALHKHSGSYSPLTNSRWVWVYFNSLSWVAISFNRVPHFTSGLPPLVEVKRYLHKLSKAHPNLGSSWTTPSRLGGSPPRVTNASHELNDVQQCLRCLISLKSAHKGFSLLPNSRDHTRSNYLTKRGWGS